MNDVSLYMAFAAGLISFLSPCILPLVPGYVSFVSGVSIGQTVNKNGNITLEGKDRTIVLLNSLFFVMGFSLIFVLLGASATLFGALIGSKISVLTKIAGLIIIFFGIFKLGLIRHFFFYKEMKFHLKDRRFGLVGASIIGASFAFGWTPCVGPILAGILAYAGTLDKVIQGSALLFIYSMGLGIPFLLTAVGINKLFRFFSRIKRYLGLIEKISGLVMIILGLMIFFNKLILIPGYLSFLNSFAL